MILGLVVMWRHLQCEHMILGFVGTRSHQRSYHVIQRCGSFSNLPQIWFTEDSKFTTKSYLQVSYSTQRVNVQNSLPSLAYMLVMVRKGLMFKIHYQVLPRDYLWYPKGWYSKFIMCSWLCVRDGLMLIICPLGKKWSRNE